MSPEIGAFDANNVTPQAPREPLPAGWYAMQIVASEIKQSKTSDGQYLQLEIEVLEATHPELKGRKVWERLNLWNANAQAVEIAQRTLSSICRACGQMQISDSDLLHGKPLAVKVKVRPAKGDYDESNDITGYDAMSARFQGGGAPAPQHPVTTPAAAGGAPAPAAAAPAGAAPASSAPPWQRKG